MGVEAVNIDSKTSLCHNMPSSYHHLCNTGVLVSFNNFLPSSFFFIPYHTPSGRCTSLLIFSPKMVSQQLELKTKRSKLTLSRRVVLKQHQTYTCCTDCELLLCILQPSGTDMSSCVYCSSSPTCLKRINSNIYPSHHKVIYA